MSAFYEPKKQRENLNKRELSARIIFDAILFLAVLFAPWWLFALLAFSGMMYWEKFYEAIIAAILFDALFGFPVEFRENFSFQYFFFTAALVFYFLIAFVKTKIR